MRPGLLLRTRRYRRWGVVLALVACSGLLLVLDSVWGQAPISNPDDARNLKGGEKNGGIPSLDCWAHHRGEGMKDSHVVLPIFPQQVLPNTEDVYTVQVINSWKYVISELLVEMTLLGNETLIVPTNAKVAEATNNLYKSWRDELRNAQVPASADERPSEVNLTFPVAPQATALFARLELKYRDAAQPPPGLGVLDNNVKSLLFPPGAKQRSYSFEPRENPDQQRVRTINLDPKFLESGEWRFNLKFDSGAAATAEYLLNVTVLYGSQAGQTFQVFYTPRVPGPAGEKHPLEFIPKGGVYTVEIPVQHLGKGTQEFEIRARALLYYRHQDGKTPDEDQFNRYARVKVVVGDQRVESAISGATAQSLGVDARLVAGEVSGFAAAFLLPPSLMFGGTYGRSSRRLFNNLLGGAKRRVMYHNLMSLGLTFVAAVHIVLFMLEIRYTVLMGVMWGGLGALALLVLGLTGYYQVPLIQKYGYNWWRYVHLAFGILVVVFVAYHSLVDGPDFDFIRKSWPAAVQKFLQDFNLAYK